MINDDLSKRQKLSSNKARWNVIIVTTRATAGIAIYLLIGCLVLTNAEGWSIADAIYFCMVTVSTVGYGDLVPTKTGTKAFAIFLIFFGIIVVFAQ